MATTIVFRNLTTFPRAVPPNGYKDMLVANPLASASDLSTDATTPVERPLLQGGVEKRFWSERVAAEVTIAGLATFSFRCSAMTAGFTGRFRAYLSKITVGGSNVETLIGQADAVADLVASTQFAFSFTPSSPVTVAPNERFICRVTVMPIAGSFGTGTVSLRYNTGSVSGTSSVTFTETVTFRPNGVTFRGLDTTTIGIGTFYDLSETISTEGIPRTGVVNTTAGGTEIQWTKTAGGAVMGWISPRVAGPGWTVDAINLFGSLPVGVHESNAAANCTVCLKLFRRNPDGTELLVATWTYTTSELPTSATKHVLTAAMGALAQATNFAEDDRIVVRYYIVPFTGLTMGGGYTCTLTYDYDVAGSTGDNQIVLLDSPEFKAEGDPDASASIVPSGGSMVGLSNGQ